MGKVLLILVLIILIVLVVVYFMFFNKDNKPEPADSTTTTVTAENQEHTVSETAVSSDEALTDISDEAPVTDSDTTNSSGAPEEAGGNPDVSDASVLSVTVSEDRYFVDNHEVSFEELVEKVSSLGEGSYVKLYDEKSTLKAFSMIKDYLDENNIMYEEE